jgi:hypothetical protein
MKLSCATEPVLSELEKDVFLAILESNSSINSLCTRGLISSNSNTTYSNKKPLFEKFISLNDAKISLSFELKERHFVFLK